MAVWMIDYENVQAANCMACKAESCVLGMCEDVVVDMGDGGFVILSFFVAQWQIILKIILMLLNCMNSLCPYGRWNDGV